ncbi:MAG: hypothetical protein QOJ03_2936 [Frankiaceae bacterium]|nr:hypothetical protein [Frankiaceae bacterium]
MLLQSRAGIDGGFLDGAAKMAWIDGAIEWDVRMPTELAQHLPGRKAGRDHAPLRVTEATLITAAFRCDRGLRDLPAYRLHLTGLRGSCVVLAPEVAPWWPVGEEEHLGTGGEATVEDDGLTVHFPAFGGVLTDFHRAEFQEHATYVVGRAITSERKAAAGTAVGMLAVVQQVAGSLASPLGGRALLNTSGQPIAVTRSNVSCSLAFSTPPTAG